MIPVERLHTLAIRKPVKDLVDLFGEYYSPYYSFFYYYTQHIKTGLCVDLGVEKGRGCYSLALGSNDIKVIGLDTVSKREHFHRNVEFWNVPSLPPPVFPRPITFLHIDTEHSYAMAEAEFNAYEPYLEPGAVVCFDDLCAMENDVWKFFNTLPYKKFVMNDLHPICGFGVVVLEREQK